MQVTTENLKRVLSAALAEVAKIEAESTPEPDPIPEPTPDPTPDPLPEPDVLTNKQLDLFFSAIGLPSGTAAKRRESTLRWQEASTWTEGGLKVDGIPGKNTSKDIRIAMQHGNRFSDHFHPKEFRCKGPTHSPDCKVIQSDWELIEALEKARAKGFNTEQGLVLTSAYRCRGHNAEVGGATSSQHIVGLAVDVPIKHSAGWWKGLGFHRLGVRDGLVRHVDMKPGFIDYEFKE